MLKQKYYYYYIIISPHFLLARDFFSFYEAILLLVVPHFIYVAPTFYSAAPCLVIWRKVQGFIVVGVSGMTARLFPTTDSSPLN